VPKAAPKPKPDKAKPAKPKAADEKPKSVDPEGGRPPRRENLDQ
jgi:hypothetical protein